MTSEPSTLIAMIRIRVYVSICEGEEDEETPVLSCSTWLGRCRG